MAGFTKDLNPESTGLCEFHIDDPDVAVKIRKANNHNPIIHMQLDGDELDAALWGLENYKK